jgi:hypothetical protein
MTQEEMARASLAELYARERELNEASFTVACRQVSARATDEASNRAGSPDGLEAMAIDLSEKIMAELFHIEDEIVRRGGTLPDGP